MLDRVTGAVVSNLRRAGVEDDDVVDPFGVDCVDSIDGDVVDHAVNREAATMPDDENCYVAAFTVR